MIKKRFKVGRVRFLMKPPRTCLSWHRDPEMRLHIPIITNKGCKMVIEDEAFHMPANGSGYVTDNTKYHNFFNGSEIERVHLVATILQGNLDDMHLTDESWRDEVKDLIKLSDNAYKRLNELRNKNNKKFVRLDVKGGIRF